MNKKDKKELRETVLNGFTDIIGLVWGIEAVNKSWSDNQMKAFNKRTVDVRNDILDLLEAK